MVLKNWTDTISYWLLRNGLALNPSKSEVIEFGTAQALHKSNISLFDLYNCDIETGFQCRRKCHCRLRSNQKPRSGTQQASFIRCPSEQNMQGHTVTGKVLSTHQECSTGHPGPYRGKFDRIPPGLLQLATCWDGTDKRHQTTTCSEQHRAHRHWNKPLRPHSTSAQETALATCWLQDKV